MGVTVSCLLVLLRRVVLGDGLGALRHGVLGQLTREHEADSRLDLAAADGVPLVVAGQAAGLGGDALKDVLDERVEHDHGLLGDAGVGVHLLQHLVDVAGVAGGVRLFAALGSSVGLLGGLLGLARRFAGLLSGSLSTAGGEEEKKKCEEPKRTRE